MVGRKYEIVIIIDCYSGPHWFYIIIRGSVRIMPGSSVKQDKAAHAI